MSQYRLTGEGVGPQSCVDENDHVTLCGILTWWSTDGIMRSLGLDRESGQSYIAACLNIAYRCELRLGEARRI